MHARNYSQPGRDPSRAENFVTEQISLAPELNSARQLRQTMQSLFGQFRISAESADDFVLAVSEAFSNAVYHGTSQHGDLIEVRISTSGESCRVVLEYCGEPFTPSDPSLPTDFAARGRGRYLMERLADRVEYEFTQGRTRTHLVKRWVLD